MREGFGSLGRSVGAMALVAGLTLGVLPAATLPLRTFDTADGLPHSRVRRVIVDPIGFLWFCTPQGLARFDGGRFRSYTTDDGLPVPAVHDLLVTRSGERWVATAGGGVCRLLPRREPDARAHDVERVVPGCAFTCLLPEGSREMVALVLHEDGNGRLFVGAERGLYEIEQRAAGPRLRPVTLLPPGGSGPEPDVLALRAGPDGSLWVGTSDGLVRFAAEGERTHYRLDAPGGGRQIYALLPDRDGRLWVGHRSGLAILVPPAAGAVSAGRNAPHETILPVLDLPLAAGGRLELPEADAPGVWVTSPDGPSHDVVRSLLETRDGSIWIAQVGRGLIRHSDGLFTRWTSAEGLPDDTLSGLVEDSLGRVWAGTDLDGALRLDEGGLTSYGPEDGMGHTFVNSILEDEEGELWVIAGFFAVHRFERGRFTWGRPPPPPDVREPYFYETGLRDRRGEWWVPTARGLFRFPRVASPRDFRSLKPLAVYRSGVDLPQGRVSHLFEDARGDLWLALAGGRDFLVRRSAATGADQPLRRPPELPVESRITSMVEDRRGALWLGFNDGRVARLENPAADGPRLAWLSGLPPNSGIIRDLHVDAAGRLWFATERSGLGRVETPVNPAASVRLHGRAEGWPTSQVFCIAEDSKGLIYAGTDRGVIRLDPIAGRIRQYTREDGLRNEEVYAAHRDRAGTLWFGTLDGLSRLTPDTPVDPVAGSVLIAAVRVGGVDRPVDELGQPVVTGLEVPARGGAVQVDYFAIAAAHPVAHRYQFRLDDAAEWSPPTPDRTLHLAALPSGRHRLEVRLAHGESQGAVRPAVLELTVLPPLWRTPWFAALSLLAVAGAGYGLHRLRVAAAVREERLRSRIAADLHDDVASSLSQIAILSELGTPLPRIAGIARDTIDAMSDIVWALSPREDRLEDLLHHMRRFASDLLADREISFDLDARGAQSLRVDSHLRRQAYLIFKEAVHNIARHARARKIAIRARAVRGRLRLEIQDDGVGLPSDRPASGNGLASMRARAISLGGTLTIGTPAAGGTMIALDIPLRRRTSPPVQVGHRRPDRG